MNLLRKIYRMTEKDVILDFQCTDESFCKAGKVLSAFTAEELGLKKEDWQLPRILAAYNRVRGKVIKVGQGVAEGRPVFGHTVH
ncbi:hypothetical protein HF521_001622 [Silurus meridionalis]|uniref:Uncharacterized protein n=1 Tax=Silurus meridionalis TaxID=175797 RepID=A0A8T0B6W2_SILME|nr:hypothetical protein HF521_001622 [Silurus meridionalis]